MVEWIKTKHVGVRYLESKARPKYRGKPDRSYSIRYSIHGGPKVETVGWASEGFTAESASGIRGQIVQNIRKGEGFFSLKEKRDLERKRRAVEESSGITLQRAFEDFLEARPLKKRTVEDYAKSMKVAFPDWIDKRITDITRDMVEKRHKDLKAQTVNNFLKDAKRADTPPQSRN